MRNQTLVLGLLTLLELFGLCYTADYGDFAFPFDPSVVDTYSRLAEIENQCSPFLSSASELKPDANRGYRLETELSFYNGDWEQEYSGASLMPFDDKDMPGGGPPLICPWKLVSFEVTNVNSVYQSKTMVSLRGVLSIGITRNSTFLDEPNLTFIVRPGMSALRVDFEVVYIETEENGGERLLCLLGNATLPLRKFFDGSTDMMANYFDTAYKVEPLLVQNDQILLVLRYPQTFTISNGGIHGEMTSLGTQDFTKYFDKVHISSQLGTFSDYQFSSGKLESRPCDPCPLQDEIVEDGVIMFNSSEFCRVLKGFQDEVYRIVPNSKLGRKYDQHQNHFGPFLLGKEIKAIGSSYENLRLSMQNVICEEEATQDERKNARVSAVLRLIPATLEPYVAARRTGLSGLTLSVEGTWNSSLGQLCMVGCLGSRLEECKSQILLYFPRLISSNQRNIIFGSISSFKDEIDLYSPILFGFELYSALYRHNWYVRSYLSYNYAKGNQAIAFRERSQSAILATTIKQSLLRYPSLDKRRSLLDRLDRLSNDLRFGAFVGPETFVQIEVLSLGHLLGPLDLVAYKNGPSVGTQAGFSKFDTLNISLTLTFTEAPVKVKDNYYNHVSKLDLEGIYDPRVGTSYLIGCRKVLIESIDIEGGLDCLIEVKVEYSSETTRWLINPTAKITIASQRNQEDQLYFTPIRLHTFMLHDRKHEKSVIFRKIFEGGLRVLLLLVSVALIWSQLCHMKKNANLVPYVSLVMLSMQIFGYGFGLISKDEILIKSKETKYYKDQPYNLQSCQVLMEVLYFTEKLLVLAALLLTARLFKLVFKARNALRAQGGLQFGDVPSDKQVLLITLAVFILSSQLSLLVYWSLGQPGKHTTEKLVYMLQIIANFADQVRSSPEYFLVPQLIADRLSKTRVNPLRRAYVIGFVSISLLQLLYDSVRDPVDNPI